MEIVQSGIVVDRAPQFDITPRIEQSGVICWRRKPIIVYADTAASMAFTPSQGPHEAWAALPRNSTWHWTTFLKKKPKPKRIKFRIFHSKIISSFSADVDVDHGASMVTQKVPLVSQINYTVAWFDRWRSIFLNLKFKRPQITIF